MSANITKSFVERVPVLVQSHINEISRNPHPYSTVRLCLDIFQWKRVRSHEFVKMFATIQTGKIFPVILYGGFQLGRRSTTV